MQFKSQVRFLLCIILLISASGAYAGKPHYVFYLHGAIVEGTDGAPVSGQYGKYDYPRILTTLKNRGYVVLSEIRPAGVNAQQYAAKIAKQIDSLKSKGVSSEQIAVIGASKGALITMIISGLVKDSKVKYIAMAGCFESTKSYGLNLYGQILSIYEASDDIGKSCQTIKENSKGISKYREIELHTGLHHGFLFNPLKEWTVPAFEWIEAD